MNKEWKTSQHPHYLSTGLLLCLFLGLLVGGVVYLYTVDWLIGVVCAVCMAIWVGMLYFESQHD